MSFIPIPGQILGSMYRMDIRYYVRAIETSWQDNTVCGVRMRTADNTVLEGMDMRGRLLYVVEGGPYKPLLEYPEIEECLFSEFCLYSKGACRTCPCMTFAGIWAAESKVVEDKLADMKEITEETKKEEEKKKSWIRRLIEWILTS
jgi:hypothetical protein